METSAGAEPTPPAEGTRRSWIASQFPPFTSRQWRVFWISTTAGYWDSYDVALLSLALRQIQRGLGVAEASLGAVLSVIRLGYIGALLITPFADIFGRRRLLLYTIVGYTLFTALSATAPEIHSFVIAQVLARTFSGAEATISLVILAEEVDAAVRGWAIGLQGALAITGYGLAAIVFGFITIVPYGWRGLYTLALVPLLLIIPLRRLLPESRRFKAEALKGFSPHRAFEPLLLAFRAYPRRVATMFAVWFLYAMGAAPAMIFVPKYLQEVHHWAPAQVSSLYVFGGAIGILGNIFSGRISDRLGRRVMGGAFLLVGPFIEMMIYATGSRAVIAFWVGALFCDQAATTVLNTFGSELFPTSHRAAAGGIVMLARYGGGAVGLLLEGVLYHFTASHWSAVCYLLIAWVIAAIAMLTTFPETAGRELEAIAPEAEAVGFE
ncbi:MAG TPA: MFS transporter [Candidatus Binataceae bacterium]|nr:MFS transporter [Candidatus Binataceae bacterium]